MGQNRKETQLPVIAGAVPIGIGSLVLLGWYLDVPTLVRLTPTLPPMQATTALAFLFAGLALLAVERKHVGAAAILAGGVTLAGALAVAGHLVGLPGGFGPVLAVDQIGAGAIRPSPMAPKSALAFLLAGAALLFLAVQRRENTLPPLLTLVGAVAVALLALEDLAKLLVESTGMGPRTLKQMAPAATIAFLVSAAGIARLAVDRLRAADAVGWRPALGAATAVLLVAGLSAHGIRSTQVASLRRLTEVTGEQVAHQLGAAIDARRQALSALADRLATPGTDSTDWTAFASAIVGHVEGVRRVAWQTADGVQRWSAPVGSGRISDKGTLYVPAVVGGSRNGVVVADLDLAVLSTRAALDGHFGMAFDIDGIAVQLGATRDGVDPVFVATTSLSLPGGLLGAAQIWPSAALVREERRPLPLATLALGVIFAALLAATLHAAAVGRSRALRLAAALDSLAAETAERRRAENALASSQHRLRESQKMEAVARLAGGMAHHFNNLLSVVRGYADLLANGDGEARHSRAYVDEIRLAASRGAELTRSLLTVSASHVLEPRTLDLRELVSEQARALGRLLGDRIELRIRTESNDTRVHIDPTPFVTALMTLASNARAAMPDGGRFTLALRNRGVSAPEAEALGVRPGSYVELEAADTGSGMSEDTRARVFEPFGSLATAGETGLGLAMLYGFVRQSGGVVEVDSAPDWGSVFRILLPHADSRATPEPAPAGHRRSGRVILVVEDEDALRRLTVRILEREGFEVLAAHDGEDALALAESRLSDLDLLLTDVVMPGMDGRMLARKIRERCPGLPVLFVSGYTADALTDAAGERIEASLVQKPFEATTLLAHVHALLGESAPA